MRIVYFMIHVILLIAFIVMLWNSIATKETWITIGVLIGLIIWNIISLVKEAQA